MSASPATAALPLRDPAARGRLGALLAAIVVLWPLLVLAEFRPAALFEAGNLQVMADFLRGFLPPSTAPDFLALLARATLETLAIATAGIALAFLHRRAAGGAGDAAPCRSRASARARAAARRGACAPARARVLTVLRAIPEVVWALIFVRALGLGPGAGVLALAVTYGGMLGKVYAEILESGDTRPARALLEAGSGRLGALFYALVPSTAQELASYTVYRWECAVRASVVMGFVGAGGLGQLMDQSMKMLNGGEASTILLVFLLLVLLADAASALIRKVLGMSTAGGAATRPARYGPCWACLALALALLAAVVASFAYLAVDWRAAVQRRVAAPDGASSSPSSSRPTSRRRSSPRRRGARCRPSPSPPSAPCSRSARRALLALPAAGPLRPGAAAGGAASCSTCCAACPSWCGRR